MKNKPALCSFGGRWRVVGSAGAAGVFTEGVGSTGAKHPHTKHTKKSRKQSDAETVPISLNESSLKL